MKRFAKLYNQLDQTHSTLEKIDSIKEYFQEVNPEDAAWALFFLIGSRFKRLISPQKLFEWSMEVANIPSWLAIESYSAVGDVAETVSLLVKSPVTQPASLSLSEWIHNNILPLKELSEEQQKSTILKYWSQLDFESLFLFNKILTGSFRVGVSQQLTIQALSKAFAIPKEIVSQRLMGHWIPSKEFFQMLVDQQVNSVDHLNPYPFYLASPLDDALEELGLEEEWFAEWKWDGIRAQAVKRGDKTALWSRGNELVSPQFPDLLAAIEQWPTGTVIDGEILAYDEKPLSFHHLQQRLGRKKLTAALMKKIPLVFMMYDLLEYQGEDIRHYPLVERRTLLEHYANYDSRLLLSPLISFEKWNELHQRREEASENGTEGLILKRKASHYGVGRRRGSWWKYKIDPKAIDAVLLYAQPGQGWRANLYTDYTFGVWKENELVPIAKAYSGLTQEEILRLDKWIRTNTEEKFGPVRRVRAEQVFEIGFEGIQPSSRHKSGVALRFPRILRWRTDKPASECNTLEQIKSEFL